MRSITERIRINRSLYELVIITPVSRLLDELERHPEGKQIHAAIKNYLHDYGRQVFNLDFVETVPARRTTALCHEFEGDGEKYRL